MKKVLIIGCPGSGKSTFARKLAKITGLPLHYLDMIWHRPDRTTVSRDEFDDKLEELLDKEEWILDGKNALFRFFRLFGENRCVSLPFLYEY